MTKIKTITVIGAGALGSNLIQIGRNFPVGWIAIDDDRIEKKNIASQFHTRQGLGRNKATALSQTMKGLFGLNVKAIPHRLTADNAEQLLGGADLVIDCLDNGPSRRVVQALVRKAGIPCLHGALAADGQFGAVVWDGNFTVDDEDVVGQATCEGGEFLPFIMMVAAELAHVLQVYLDDGKKIGFHLFPNGKTPL